MYEEFLQDETSIDSYLRINELKNYVYCPRIPFYAMCMHLDRDTEVARIGIENEQDTKHRMKRRKHALHAIHDGIRHYDVLVIVHELHLIGKLDEMIETKAGVYLVDYKDTERDYGYWKMQMCAYKLGIEATGHQVLGCYVYSIPEKHYQAVKLTNRDETKLHQAVEALQRMIQEEVCPSPTPQHRKCQNCQYERFCNDVL